MSQILGSIMARRALEKESRRWPLDLVEVKPDTWPARAVDTASAAGKTMVAVYRSRMFFVQICDEGTCLRLTVNRTKLTPKGEYVDGITWDQIQEIKRACGYGDWYGIEIYPRDEDVVNVANMRHLWLFREPLPWGWFRNAEVCS